MVPPPVAAQSGDPSNPAYAALFRRLSYLPPAELTATMQQTSEKVLEYLAGQQMVFTFIRQDPAFHAAFMAKALPHFRSVYEHSQNQCEPQISALLARSLSPTDAVTVEAFMRTPLWAGVRSAVMGRFNASSASTASDEKLEVILERNLAKARDGGRVVFSQSFATAAGRSGPSGDDAIMAAFHSHPVYRQPTDECLCRSLWPPPGDHRISAGMDEAPGRTGQRQIQLGRRTGRGYP
jgi:hypothetical protein